MAKDGGTRNANSFERFMEDSYAAPAASIP